MFRSNRCTSLKGPVRGLTLLMTLAAGVAGAQSTGDFDGDGVLHGNRLPDHLCFPNGRKTLPWALAAP